jgi:HAD superfamily hydrolase (TIGR01450 family)
MPDSGRSLKDVTYFIFDLDHTIWHWNTLIPGVKDTVRKLKSRNKEVVYLTNNSLLSREEFARKLSGMGLKTDPEEVISSAYVAAQTLSDQGVEEVYAVGEQGLIDELEAEDIQTSKEADDVLVGFDRNFTYWKMAQAAELLRDGASLWVTGKGSKFTTEGRTLPGDLPIIESISIAAGGAEYTQVGKPSEYMQDVVKDEFPVVPKRSILIGDHMESDVVMGNRLGIATGLVRGGETEKSDLKDLSAEETPDYVFEEFKRILRKI